MAGADRAEAIDLFRRDFTAAQLLVGGPQSLDGSETLVAETERAIAGALAWRLADGARHIVALATDPMWQRAGVGGNLLAEVELLARRHSNGA